MILYETVHKKETLKRLLNYVILELNEGLFIKPIKNMKGYS